MQTDHSRALYQRSIILSGFTFHLGNLRARLDFRLTSDTKLPKRSNNMENILVLSVICFIAMLSPGPDFILVSRTSLVRPKKEALATAMGVVAGCFVHATYCILGLAIIITQSVILFSFIKYIGAAYLIYLGTMSLLSRTDGAPVSSASAAPRSLTSSFIQGFLCNVLNPKLAIFLLSLFTQFVSVNASILDKLYVGGVFVGEAMLYWPSLVLLLQCRYIQNVLISFHRVLNVTCGSMLIYIGARVATRTD